MSPICSALAALLLIGGLARAAGDELAGLAPSALQVRAAELARGGPEAARAALAAWEQGATEARRARAWIVWQAGSAAEVEPAALRLDDPDEDVRATLVRFLARPDLGTAQLEARTRALTRVARSDPAPALVARAIAALSELDQPMTLSALAELFDELEGEPRALAGHELSVRAHAREALLRRLCASWPPATAAQAALFDDALVARLLAPLARALVDLPALAAEPRARWVLVAAAGHPDPRLAQAARGAFDSLLGRLELYGDAERSERLLSALAADGWDGRAIDAARARLWLRQAGSAQHARELALALGRRARAQDGAVGAREARGWGARAALLAGCAALAEGELEPARAQLEAAAEPIDALRLCAPELAPQSGAGERAQASQLEALRCLSLLCVELAPDVAATGACEPSATRAARRGELARRVHLLSLQCQGLAWRAGFDASSSLDTLFEAELSPVALALENPRLPAWPARRALALREALARELARVAPRELPGCGVAEGDDDPLRDPERRALLEEAQLARIELLQRELGQLSGRLLRQTLEDPCGPELDLAERAATTWYEREDALRTLRSAEEHGPELLELRLPSTVMLTLARAQRDEGRPEKARALLEALRADLERTGAGARFLWGLELQAELEITLGSTWSDAGEPARAVGELERAVERLQAIEDLIVQRKLSPLAAARVRSQRASALVSLAVNANVKQHDQARALAYFERAWELRQDEFMRVLRACYRARAGRADEARAILREVEPSPLAHYNMACTYALCGDVDLALDFLRREFEENQISPDAAEKQRAWARQDPDLARLRGDARFEALVGK